MARWTRRVGLHDRTVLYVRRRRGRTEYTPGGRNGFSIKGQLHDRARAAVAQNRTSVAQWAGDSPSHAPHYSGAHSDGPCYGTWRLQMSAYISDVPPNCGGFTVWPRSHSRIWREQWKAFKTGEKHTDKHLAVRVAGGYTDPVIGQIKEDTQPFDCHGPTGTVILWHTKILHIAGQNASNDVIRQATIYGFKKTPESLPDPLVVDNTDSDIWRDWSDEVRA